MKQIHILALLAAVFVLVSCASTQATDTPVPDAGGAPARTEERAAPPGFSSGLSSRTLRLVEEAVFEVIVQKAQDDPAIYEKELDWDLVPYAVRTDDYYSIGTAFAISGTELITAFHVINLG
jgi:hypothetical protein